MNEEAITRVGLLQRHVKKKKKKGLMGMWEEVNKQSNPVAYPGILFGEGFNNFS
jgi:hypothetical protein